MRLAEQHIIKRNDPRYAKLDDAAFASKNLWNAANYLVCQSFFFEHSYLDHVKVFHQIKSHEAYQGPPAKVSNQVLIQLHQAWKGFFEAMEEWRVHPEKFVGRPQLPKYKPKTAGRNLLVYEKGAVSKRALKRGMIALSGIGELVPTKHTRDTILQVRVIPRRTHYVIEVMYEQPEQARSVDPSLFVSIDLGVNNLAALTSNQPGFPALLVNGRPLKALNQWYNKRRERLQKGLAKHARFTSRELERLTDKRNRRVKHYLHLASRRIINLLVQRRIGTLVVGLNPLWKQQVEMGKRQNQPFVQIPHTRFIDMLRYKAQLVGITVLVTEEPLLHMATASETRRRNVMAHTNIKLYGTNWCSDCKRSKKFLGEQRVHYDFINIEEDMEGQAYVQKLQNGGLTIPTILFEDGSTLIEPSNAEVAAKLGLETKAKCEFYDLIIVGGGPTALTAAIYGARDGYDVLVIERSGLGGQAGITERLDNYPGFPEGVTGADFADRVIEQSKRYGVELLSAQNVVAVGNDEGAHFVETESGHRYRSNAVLIATGSTYKRIGVPGEDDYIGAGVHFCATCDGPFYKGREVAVIGGGNSAVEEAAFLTRFCPKVTILARGSELTANKIAVDKALNSPEMEVLFNTEVIEFKGKDNHLDTVIYKNRETGEVSELHVPGVFVFIGLNPNSKPFKDIAKLDAQGFIMTGIDFQTSTEGIFAAGDVRSGSTKQLVSAAGEGAAAALAIREHLRGHDAHTMEKALVGTASN